MRIKYLRYDSCRKAHELYLRTKIDYIDTKWSYAKIRETLSLVPNLECIDVRVITTRALIPILGYTVSLNLVYDDYTHLEWKEAIDVAIYIVKKLRKFEKENALLFNKKFREARNANS